MKLVAQRLARHGRTIVNVRSDGACQFRSVSVGLWEDVKHRTLLRGKALDTIRAQPPKFHDCQVYASRDRRVGIMDVRDDFEAYAAVLRDKRSWGEYNTFQVCNNTFYARVLLVTTYYENYELIVESCDRDIGPASSPAGPRPAPPHRSRPQRSRFPSPPSSSG